MDELRGSLRDRYGIDFPVSFFRFREFLLSLPPGLLDDAIEVRPDSVIALGDIDPDPTPAPPDLRWECRYYDDPPEFLTLLAGNTDGLHWGYYVDDPAAPRFPVAHYYSRDSFEFSFDGDDLFEAIREHLEDHQRTVEEYMEMDSEAGDEGDYRRTLEKIAEFRALLQKHGTGDRPETGDEYLERYTDPVPWRKPVAATRDRTGICVAPELYRPVATPDPYQIYNYVPTAEDVERQAAEAMRLLRDGYPGAALKLGKDLWVYHEHATTTYALLDAAYAALGREWLRSMLRVARQYRAFCDANPPRRPPAV